MAPEGMGHALTQIFRVLKPRGTLVDVRPNRFSHPRQRQALLPAVSWRTIQGDAPAGKLEKTAPNLRRHRAATQTVHEAIRRSLFVLEATETFPFLYHFRGLAALDAFLQARWISTILPRHVRRRLAALQAAAPDGEIVVAEPVRLNVLRKP